MHLKIPVFLIVIFEVAYIEVIYKILTVGFCR